MAEASKYVLCPYCGLTQLAADKCQECGGIFEPLSRRATQIAMGPWYIRDKNHPFRPGCSYEMLLRQIKAGKIKANAVIRGPTTRQFWSVARNVPGVAHLLGLCHRCGEHVDPAATVCKSCGEPFQTPDERDELGLLYPTEASAQAAQRQLEIELSQRSGASPDATPAGSLVGGPGHEESRHGGAAAHVAPKGPGMDLLNEVLGAAGMRESAPPPPLVVAPPAAPDTPIIVGGGAATSPSTAATRRPEASRLLQFDEEHAPRSPGTQARSRTAPVIAKAEAIDFAPSDEQPGDEAAAEAGAAAPRRLGLTTWLLIAFNIILLAAVGIYVYVAVTAKPTDTPTTPTTQRQPAAHDPDTADGSGSSPGDSVAH